MRKLPENLINKQNQTKKNTLDKIQNAIDEIKAEGALVSTKKLIERTGLARSTFSKIHVKELLKENRVCQFKDRQVIAEEKYGAKAIETLQSELDKAYKKINKLTQELEKEKSKVTKLKFDNNQLNENYQLLLGKWHVLLKKAKIKGIDIY